MTSRKDYTEGFRDGALMMLDRLDRDFDNLAAIREEPFADIVIDISKRMIAARRQITKDYIMEDLTQ